MTEGSAFVEGWYLMNLAELDAFLAAFRRGDPTRVPSSIVPLTREAALAFRDRGNVPDADGRSLRLVLRIDDALDLATLDERRLRFEPDAYKPPTWRVPDSKPVNVVPLRRPGIGPVAEAASWWDEPGLAELETEWKRTGGVGGIKIPGEYRGFVYKTIIALRNAGDDVSVESIVDSIARWLSPEQTDELRRALRAANP